MVTDSTMGCRSLPVSGARLTDQSPWPSGRQQNSLGRRGQRGGQGEGPCLGSLHKAAQLLSGSSLLSIGRPLCVCLIIFSSAANCPDYKTLNSHSLRKKSETLLSDHHSKSASCWWVKFSKGSVLLIVPESPSHPTPNPTSATHTPWRAKCTVAIKHSCDLEF